MFQKLFKGVPTPTKPAQVSPPSYGHLPVTRELDAEGQAVVQGLGVNFARQFCADLSPETRDALFPEGLEKT